MCRLSNHETCTYTSLITDKPSNTHRFRISRQRNNTSTIDRTLTKEYKKMNVHHGNLTDHNILSICTVSLFTVQVLVDCIKPNITMLTFLQSDRVDIVPVIGVFMFENNNNIFARAGLGTLRTHQAASMNETLRIQVQVVSFLPH